MSTTELEFKDLELTEDWPFDGCFDEPPPALVSAGDEEWAAFKAEMDAYDDACRARERIEGSDADLITKAVEAAARGKAVVFVNCVFNIGGRP